MIEISTKALELNAGMDFLYVYLTKSAEPNAKGRNKDLVNHVRATSIHKGRTRSPGPRGDRCAVSL